MQVLYIQEEVEAPGQARAPEVGGHPLVQTPHSLLMPHTLHTVKNTAVLGPQLQSVTHCIGRDVHILVKVFKKNIQNSRSSRCTCKPGLHQVQRVKRQSGHHTTAQSRHQVSYFHMAEDLLDVSGDGDSGDVFSGLPCCLCGVTVIRCGAHP